MPRSPAATGRPPTRGGRRRWRCGAGPSRTARRRRRTSLRRWCRWPTRSRCRSSPDRPGCPGRCPGAGRVWNRRRPSAVLLSGDVVVEYFQPGGADGGELDQLGAQLVGLVVEDGAGDLAHLFHEHGQALPVGRVGVGAVARAAAPLGVLAGTLSQHSGNPTVRVQHQWVLQRVRDASAAARRGRRQRRRGSGGRGRRTPAARRRPPPSARSGGTAGLTAVVVAGGSAEAVDGPAQGAGVVPQGRARHGAGGRRVERAHGAVTLSGRLVQVWAAMILAASAGVKVTAMVASQRSHTTATPTLNATAYR